MYKDFRYINAGENEIYRYGRKARERVASFMAANENGFISIPVDGGKYYSIGTSNGKYGEFAKNGADFFSVNNGGYAWAKVGTEKADKLLVFMQAMIDEMLRLDAERCAGLVKDDEEEEED